MAGTGADAPAGALVRSPAVSIVAASVRHRRLVLAVAAAGALALAPGLARLSTDNSPSVFFSRTAAAVERYEAFQAAFGSDSVLRLVAWGDGVWTAEGLAWLGRIEREATTLPGAIGAVGLAGHYRRDGWPPADPAAWRQEALADPLDRGAGWIDRDGRAATVSVLIGELEPPATAALVAAAQRLLATPPAGVETAVVGLPVLNLALDAASTEVEGRDFPLLVVLAVGLLAVVFRDLAGVLLPLLFVGASLLMVMGPMGWSGTSLNMVLVVLPTLLFVIALATALHLLMRHRTLLAQHGGDAGAAVVATYGEKGWSVLWTGLTTLIGFASLAVSPVGAVRELGLWAAFGLAAMTAAAFVLYPALLAAAGKRLHPPPQRGYEAAAGRLGRRLAAAAFARRGPILVAVGVLTALALAGLPRLRVESNALRYLPATHPARRSIEALEARGVGVSTLELVAKLPATAPAGGVDPEALLALGAAGRELADEGQVLGVLHAGLLLEEALGQLPAFLPVPSAARPGMALQGLRSDPEAARFLPRFVDDAGRRLRLTLFVATGGYRELEPLVTKAEAAVRRALPGAEVAATGALLLLLETHRTLLQTLAVSFGLTFVAAFAVFRLLLPSTRLAALALVPSVVPVVGMLGLMGWAHLPLDVATVMVSSVVLGLADDDVLHALGHYRLLAPRLGRADAVATTQERTAPACLLTGAILIAGFGVCGLSQFTPIAHFGLLAAYGIALAVAANLVLVPALLTLGKT